MDRERSFAAVKLQEYKNKKRREEKQAFRKRLRDEYMTNEIKKNNTADFNAEISNYIRQGNIKQLYETLYRPKGEQIHQPLADLQEKQAINLFLFLSKDLNDMQSLLILAALINIHYKTIFLNRFMEEQCQYTVKCLYEHANQSVQIIRTQAGISKENRTNNLCYILIGGQLGCLKNLIYLKDMKTEQDYRFDEVQKQEYLYHYLYAWLDQLYNNSLYLCIMIVFEYDKDYSSKQIFNSRIVSNFTIIFKLLQQADPSSCPSKACSLPSVILAIFLLNNIKQVHVLQQCLQYYLRATKIVYTLSQPSLGINRYYRIDTFISAISGVSNLTQKICGEFSQPNLGICMQQQNFFAFCTTIMRTQTQHIRLHVHRILKNVINSILVNHGRLQDYLYQSMIGLIIEGLDSNNQDIIQISLEKLYLLLLYCEEQDGIDLMEWINQFQVNTTLENLQYSKNYKISQLTTQIIIKKKKIQGKQDQTSF